MPRENNGADDGRIERRSFLKAAGTSTVFGGGMFAAASSANAKEGVAVTPEETTPPHPDLKPYQPDPSLLEVGPQWTLLTLQESTVLDRINDSDFSAKEKREARKTFGELRSQFPVVEKENEEAIRWTLARDAKSPSDEDRKNFSSVNKIFTDGNKRRGASTQWWGGNHKKQTRSACDEIGVSSSDADTIVSYAAAPDEPDHFRVEVADWIPHDVDIEEGLEYGLNKALHHYGQYLDTGVFSSYYCYHDGHDETLADIGAGDDVGKWHLDEAKNAYYRSTQNEYLGKATHFPEDMGNPLHTGMGWEQINLELVYDSSEGDNVNWDVNVVRWYHDRYEQFAAENWSWDTDHYFRYYFDSNNCSADYCYYSINDAAQALWDLADYTGQYSAEVFNKVTDEGDVHWSNWSSNTEDRLRQITENCMHEAGLYTRGYIKEIY